jgi:hypothetical protein
MGYKFSFGLVQLNLAFPKQFQPLTDAQGSNLRQDLWKMHQYWQNINYIAQLGL